ncbi:hypothetical protein [Streptomyces sp. NRRL F-5123]|uniref:hypothetical protein n=1 Tax=Streptomyces sp. NRRL F-5123 TaxID=1463856 RepID=UPI00131A7E78|nr:hypothetical protein [Streptomyces sp. NRRL F-5123]
MPERPAPAGNGAALDGVLAVHRPDDRFARDVQEVRDLLTVDRPEPTVPASGR